MRLVLVGNPGSGGGTAVEDVARVLTAHGSDVCCLGPERAGEARGLAPDRLAVAGGDGTIAGVAEISAELGVPLAVVPSGTANDFARATGLPLDTEAACALAADPDAGLREIELAWMAEADAGADDRGRPFVNVASLGLAVKAGESAEPLKRLLGPLAYAAGAVRAGATAPPLPCVVRCDGRELFAGEAWQVIVGATGAFGGGSRLGPTDSRDGLLDVAVVEAGSRLALARRARAMRRGDLHDQPGVHHARAAVVEVDAGSGARFNVDGEVVEHGPARFTARRAAVRLVVPGPHGAQRPAYPPIGRIAGRSRG